VHDQLDTRLGGDLVPQRVHVTKLPRGVDVKQRKRQRPGEERLFGKVQHHCRILPHREKHHRLFRLGDRFPQDEDALGLEPVEMGQSGSHSNSDLPASFQLVTCGKRAIA
jgi:hypothetical protein